jgi:hypothetical protein
VNITQDVDNGLSVFWNFSIPISAPPSEKNWQGLAETQIACAL